MATVELGAQLVELGAQMIELGAQIVELGAQNNSRAGGAKQWPL